MAIVYDAQGRKCRFILILNARAFCVIMVSSLLKHPSKGMTRNHVNHSARHRTPADAAAGRWWWGMSRPLYRQSDAKFKGRRGSGFCTVRPTTMTSTGSPIAGPSDSHVGGRRYAERWSAFPEALDSEEDRFLVLSPSRMQQNLQS